ncbi:UDP-glucuronate decarboxylase [hydrothermal vent metagenome]|uniref:UDP-glucuronate decarboxylase n=1 Tax=hydrothermal vent metagenome TaxID=652676 RepID=A0A3B1C129_9ZZZZ
MTHLLLAGGAGFIGSHLSEALLGDGCEVTCVDNFITSARKNIENIKSGRFTFIERDISRGLGDMDGPFDYILNFASPASPPDYLKYPVETLLAGSAGTHALLGLALRTGAVFMMASTSEVYGDPEIHPQKENYWGNVNSIGPRSCYDEAKRYAEAATMAYHRHHGLDIRILRIFNTFGPRMRVRDGRAVSNFICQALRGDDITVYGDGSQTRSFCFVTDLVEGIIALMRSSVTDPVNLGNPNEMSILDLAKMVIELTGSSATIRHEGLPEDDPKVRKPDITRANKLLGWSPRVELKDGLEKTIEYYKTTLNL